MDDDRRCTAKSKRSQQRCKRAAIRGGNVCATHGGKAPQVAGAAHQRLKLRAVEAEMRQLHPDSDIDPSALLLETIGRDAARLRMFTRLVEDLDVAGDFGVYGPDHTGDGTAHILIRLEAQERDRLAKHCKMAIDAGIEERKVRLAEEQGEMIATLLASVFDDPELDLTPAQRMAGKKGAAKRLRHLSVVKAS